MNNNINNDVFPETPHLKLWAVVEGPTSEVFPDGEEGYVLKIRASGPETHEEVRDITVVFYDIEEANNIKKEIDMSPEPLIKNLINE